VEFELGEQKVMHQILEFDLPAYDAGEEPQYIILESISSNTSKVVHIVSMADVDAITLGRGHDAEVRVTDISVSRCHAFIKKSPLGFFYIVDNKSKFGTLLLVRQPLLINSTCNNQFQIGKTLIKFKFEHPY
jgi:pSer/pThr/pTyr-binding forkhead associated (FHA) protein